jgi:hypothetical protein
METDRLSSPDPAEMPPGTELMQNTTHHHLAETQGSHQVLIPTPSNDPTDPLNWSTKGKLTVIFSQAVLCFSPSFQHYQLPWSHQSSLRNFKQPQLQCISFSECVLLCLDMQTSLSFPSPTSSADEQHASSPALMPPRYHHRLEHMAGNGER